MTVHPFTDGTYDLKDSEALTSLTAELRNVIDDLNLPRLTQDRLMELIEDREQAASTLAFIYGVRAGDAFSHVVGRLRRRDGSRFDRQTRKPAQAGGTIDGNSHGRTTERR